MMGQGKTSLGMSFSVPITVTPKTLGLSWVIFFTKEPIYSPRLSSLGNLSYLKTFPFKSEALATTLLRENMKEKTLPPFLSMERMVAGLPWVVLSKGPEYKKPSFIRESVISDTDTLFITSSLES